MHVKAKLSFDVMFDVIADYQCYQCYQSTRALACYKLA